MRSSFDLGGHDGEEADALHQPDTVLALRARTGDPGAFGLLYLRHHQATWRMAHAVSGFARHCPDIVAAAFSGLFAPSAPASGAQCPCRPALLAEVRRLARGACLPTDPEVVVVRNGHEEVATSASPDIVEAFRRLAEPRRTAWWLLEVERFTPREAGMVMVLDEREVVARHATAGRLLVAHLAAVVLSTAAPSCRPAVEQIIGGAEPDEMTARHLGCCAVCRMRREEAQRPGVALCDAVPPMPLLGPRCHRRWRAA